VVEEGEPRYRGVLVVAAELKIPRLKLASSKRCRSPGAAGASDYGFAALISRMEVNRNELSKLN